jgi:Xaa-Pro aminopeptidase
MTAAAYQQRLQRFQQHLTPSETALISKANDIFYFTGFPWLTPEDREAYLLVTTNQATLFHHSFSPVQAKSWLKTIPQAQLKTVAEQLSDQSVKKLFIDEQTLTVAEYQQLRQLTNCQLANLNQQWLWELRTIKDKEEIKIMKQAGQIASQVFKEVKKLLKPGMTEQEIANKIISLMLENQAEKPAFPIIVAFGKGSALPHYQPRDIKLKPATPILIDLGAKFNGYNSDMTRSFWFGKQPAEEFGQIEKIVKTAYQKTLNFLQDHNNQLTVKDLDDVARNHITNQGFGEQFIHTTGHGLGIEIHEPPSLSWKNDQPIKPGMVITIEPGIYLPGKFGYRHENTVLVTKNSAEVLTLG